MRTASLVLAVGLLGVAGCRKDVAAPVVACTPSSPTVTNTLDTIDGHVVAVGVITRTFACGGPINDTAPDVGGHDSTRQVTAP